MTLSSGTRLGPYEVVSALGAGGMGEVYRAHDPRLGRDVAIKVLPAGFSANPDRLHRFEQEARAAAALNHPNILAVHDIGTHNGAPYVVSEFLDGHTLREHLNGGPLPVRKAIECAAQVAHGLAAAHDKGIIHRDLKPENIFITSEGHVKILDFGLAKLMEGAPVGTIATMLATRSADTTPGIVLGTVGYMSPEQVRGTPTDHRSDIFNFGLIIHELLTAKRAFQGETSVEIMSAILRQDPPELPETVPPGVRQVVAHCLEKEPANRFQSARDLGFALTQTGTQSGTAPVLEQRSPWPRRGVIVLAALALVTLSVAASRLIWRAPEPLQWSGVMLGGPELAMLPRPSPDGHLLAFIATAEDVFQVFVMKPESGNRAQLTHDRERGYVWNISWSPDGSRIYFDRWYDQARGVFSVPVLGGEEQLVLEDASLSEALPDGSLLVVRLNTELQPQVFHFWPETGKLQGLPLEIGGVMHGFGMRTSPDGHKAVGVGKLIGPDREAGPHLYVIDLESASARRLQTSLQDDTTLSAAAVTHDGKSVLAAGLAGNVTNITAIPIDGRGPARVLLSLTSFVYSIDMGLDGSIYLDQVERAVDLVHFPPEGGHANRIATFPMAEVNQSIAVLPDGRTVTPQRAGGHVRLMAIEAGKDPVPLINTTEETAAPVTAAGPSEIAFLIGTEPRRTIAIAAVSNGRITRRIPFDKGRIDEMASAPDGKTLYCAAAGAIWAVPVSGGPPRKIRAGDAVAVDATGQNLLIELTEPPKVHLVRVPLNGGAEQEIPQTGSLPVAAAITPAAVSKDGRMVTPLGSPYWYWPPGLWDLVTGKITRIPIDYTGDFHYMAWTSGGKVMAVAYRWQSTMWKFQPEGR